MDVIDVAGEKASFKGSVAPKDYYILLKDVVEGIHYNIYEKSFRRKIGPAGTNTEVHFSWECTKSIDSYSKILITVDGDVEDMEGEKGKAKLSVKSKVVTNKNDDWDVKPFLRLFKKFYDKKIYKSTFKGIKSLALSDLFVVKNEMKAFFGLQQYL